MRLEQSVANEKIFKETRFCARFCLSGSTEQSGAAEGCSCDRSQFSSPTKLHSVPHQKLELGVCVVVVVVLKKTFQVCLRCCYHYHIPLLPTRHQRTQYNILFCNHCI